ncbi:MAG: secondary thiamine-phosphate synthase enzyme YjbQ [Nanoarchaeota archaeon]
MKSFTIKTTSKYQTIDITKKIKQIVKDSKQDSSICLVYVPHATASIIINENWDPNIGNDVLNALKKQIPENIWRHDEIDGNGAAHIKAAIVGPSEMIPIKNKELLLGTWQNIMLADFDGPKKRTIYLVLK